MTFLFFLFLDFLVAATDVVLLELGGGVADIFLDFLVAATDVVVLELGGV